MRLAGAELIGSREVLPGAWHLEFHAPFLAVGARAGQYVHVRPGDWSGLVLRRPFPIVTADPATGVLGLHITTARPGGDWMRRLRTGDVVDLLGPLGRPFELDLRSRHLLLVAAGDGVPALRFLVDLAVREGRSAVLLAGADTSRAVYPSSLLPDELEYVVATADGSLGHRGSVTGLLGEYEAWADQAFAAGPWSMLNAVATFLAGRRERLGVAQLGRKRGGGRPVVPGSPEARRKAFLQVAVDHEGGCAAGTCLGCVVPASGGSGLRVCREGPVFASDELAWEGTG